MATGDLQAVESQLDLAESLLAASGERFRRGWAQTDELRTLPATIAIYRASLASGSWLIWTERQHRLAGRSSWSGPDDHLARVVLQPGSWHWSPGRAGEIGPWPWTPSPVLSPACGRPAQTVDELSQHRACWPRCSSVAGRPAKARQLCQDGSATKPKRLGAPAARVDRRLCTSSLPNWTLTTTSWTQPSNTSAPPPRSSKCPGAGQRGTASLGSSPRARLACLRGPTFADALAAAGAGPGVLPARLLPAGASDPLRCRARVLIAAGDLAQAAEWGLDQAVHPVR